MDFLTIIYLSLPHILAELKILKLLKNSLTSEDPGPAPSFS